MTPSQRNQPCVVQIADIIHHYLMIRSMPHWDEYRK